jgi:hypothetical protein
VIFDPEVALEQVDQRQVRRRLAVGDREGLEHPASSLERGLELVDQPRLAHARLAHDADDLPAARPGRLPGPAQLLHLAPPAYEAHQSAARSHLQARAQGAHALQLVDSQRLPNALHVELSEIAELEETLGPPSGLLRQVDPIRGGDLLHSGRKAHRVALSRVIHAEVVADLPDHDFAGVEAHPHGEVQTPEPQLVGVAPQLLAQPKRRVAGPLRVVLVSDRRPKERHDPVAGVLVDGALEAVHAVRQDLEEAVEDAVPLLGVDLLGQLQRALDVGKQDGHLLALALQGGLALEDPVGEVFGGVVAGDAVGRRPGRGGQCRPALAAELLAVFVHGSA